MATSSVSPGWQQLRPRNWKFIPTNLDQGIERDRIYDLVTGDREHCEACKNVGRSAGYGPAHDRVYFYADGAISTLQCESYGRWYNPETGKMEGYAHCTCDSCF